MTAKDGSIARFIALLGRTPETLPRIERSGERLVWTDIAKGVSISLVVYWHTVEDHLAINEALIFMRMPLFFFVAGLFIRQTFAPGNERKFVAKTARFLWLYAVWALVLSVLLRIPFNLIKHRDVLTDFPTPYQMLFDPPTTLWFIYLLALVVIATMALRKVPLWILLAVTFAGYLWSATGGNFRDVEFADRCLRLYPFFLLGLISFELLNSIGPRLRAWGPAMLAGFCVLAWVVYFSPLRAIAPVTLAVSLFAVFALVCTAQRISIYPLGCAIAWIGRNSLYVYLMHRIFWAIGMGLLELDRGEKSELARILVMTGVTLVAIPTCAWIGPRMARSRKFAFLFDLPPILKPKAALPA